MSRDQPFWAPDFVLLTCEHAGNEVPPAFRRRFHGANAVLKSHRGLDIGALGVALRMAPRVPAPIVFTTVTRLLIDTNRSLDRPDLFSEFTRELPERDRDAIIATYYAPHRDCVARTIAAAIDTGRRVLHVGVHSCTDVLHGRTRDLDIALLFDQERTLERELCEHWRDELRRREGELRYPFNEPYNGADDGFTTTLRNRFDPGAYLGIEVELRQGMILRPAEQRAAGDLLANALRAVLHAAAGAIGSDRSG
ncbi:MAG: N-formylglutamate amidohydrolase [Phycisphaeraceae bacterium]|nr:N-formylglutamate amidohydrolase [Phycisphaeraceae bacterium]MCB9847529.1 N-formylglutamate amidohydrolase [Phycisphaeraceae bacterium]